MLLRVFISLCLLSTSVLATKVIVFYKPGSPDTIAPAQILAKKYNANLVPHGQIPTLEELAEINGYDLAFSLDTYTTTEAMATFLDHLRTVNPTAQMIVFTKNGDPRYDNLSCEHEVVDFAQSSYLTPVMNRCEMEVTEGARLLCEGLSRRRGSEKNPDAAALAEVYSVEKCDQGTLVRIMEGTAEQLRAEVLKGGHFLEKAKSVNTHVVSTASETTLENGLRVGAQVSPVATTVIGPETLRSKSLDIMIILAGVTVDGAFRYSIWCNERYSARKVVEYIQTTNAALVKTPGGGTNEAAGLTIHHFAPEHVIGALAAAPLAAITR